MLDDRLAWQKAIQELQNRNAIDLLNIKNAADFRKAQLNADTAVQVAGIKSGGSSGGSDGLSKEQQENVNSLANLFTQADQTVNSGHVRQDDRNAVEAARAKMEELHDKGKIDQDTYVTYYDRLSALEDAMQRKWKEHNWADSF